MCKAAGFTNECTLEELRVMLGIDVNEFNNRLNTYSKIRRMVSKKVKGACNESIEEHAIMMVMWEKEKKTWAGDKWYSVEEGLEILKKSVKVDN